jgi:hypothetical protein
MVYGVAVGAALAAKIFSMTKIATGDGIPQALFCLWQKPHLLHCLP